MADSELTDPSVDGGVDRQGNSVVPAAGMPSLRKPRRLGQPVLGVGIRKASPRDLSNLLRVTSSQNCR